LKKALVTGGSGFIGFHLADYLSSQGGTEVTVIDNMARGSRDEMFERLLAKKNVVFLNEDMTGKDFYGKLADGYDYIYHLAAINGTRNFYERPYDVLRTNILTLVNMLEWCTPENCGSFLFTSSSEGYAGTVGSFLKYDESLIPTKEDVPLTIDDVMNPRYSYGGSKILGELLTVNYCRTRKIPFKIVRYHNIYGPRMGFDHVLPEFIKRIHGKENPFPVYGGNETRAFCEVSDGVRATEAVMLSDKCAGEVVHIGNSSDEIKILDLLNKLLKIAKFYPKLDIRPAPEGCVARRCPDTGKLYNLTGYRASVQLDEGLPAIYEWYENEYGRIARREPIK
jgi:nucleoside-diphosphate-sugar epimerase